MYYRQHQQLKKKLVERFKDTLEQIKTFVWNIWRRLKPPWT